MQTAKIILFATGIIAIIGGAAAFKTRYYGNSKYCFLTTEEQPVKGSCTFTAINRSARPMGDSENFVFYTITSIATAQACALVDCPWIGVPDQE